MRGKRFDRLAIRPEIARGRLTPAHSESTRLWPLFGGWKAPNTSRINVRKLGKYDFFRIFQKARPLIRAGAREFRERIVSKTDQNHDGVMVWAIWGRWESTRPRIAPRKPPAKTRISINSAAEGEEGNSGAESVAAVVT